MNKLKVRVIFEAEMYEFYAHSGNLIDSCTEYSMIEEIAQLNGYQVTSVTGLDTED